MYRAITLRTASTILLAFAFIPLNVRAQFTVRVNEYLTQEHTQTSTDAPTTTGGYRFVLDPIVGDFTYYTLPDGSTSFGANRVFDDLDALRAQFPPGTYTAHLEREARPGRPATSATLQADFPSNPPIPSSVPRITNTEWDNGVLLVDPSFTLTLETWQDRPTDSIIRLQLQGPNGSYTYTIYGQDRTSFTINGDGSYELLPDSTYQAVLNFVDPFSSVTTPISGGVFQDQFQFTQGGGNSVSFTIVTVPEPQVAAIFVAAALAIAGTKRMTRKLRELQDREP
jgi:hypothetical protein